jgi:hypothetical protein
MAVQVNPQALADYLAEQLGSESDEMMSSITQYLLENKIQNKTKDVDPDHRCMARTWGDGCGAQCSKKRSTGTDFCKTHGKEVHTQCKRCSHDGDEVTHAYQWEHLGRVDESLPYFFPSGGATKASTPKVITPKASTPNVVTPKVVTPKVVTPKSDEDAVNTPFHAPDGTELDIDIEIDGQTYIWDEDGVVGAIGGLYDKEHFDTTGMLLKVGEHNDDSDDDDDE